MLSVKMAASRAASPCEPTNTGQFSHRKSVNRVVVKVIARPLRLPSQILSTWAEENVAGALFLPALTYTGGSTQTGPHTGVWIMV